MKYLLILMFVTLNANAQSVENILKARGLEAKEKLEKLIKKENPTKLEICEKFSEAAFTSIVDDKLSKISFKKTDKSISLNLLFGFLDENKKFTSAYINVAYSKDSTEPLMYELHHIEDGWKATFFPSVRDSYSFGLVNKNCTYIFSVKDFLHPKVEENK